MGRIAGDDTHYEFRLCRIVGGVKAIPTPYGHKMPSSTSVLTDTLGIPAGAMSYHGFREGMKAMAYLLGEGWEEVLQHADTPEQLEEYLKAKGFTPNTGRDAAGERGTKAHTVLECLAEYAQRVDLSDEPGDEEPTLRQWAEALAEDEERTEGTRYGYAAIEWWDKEVQPHIENGFIDFVVSELPVFSIEGWYAGTLDVGLHWTEGPLSSGWEIVDAKTHKPASGFTKEGQGPGYDKDAAQIRSYRDALEEIFAHPERFVGYESLPPGPTIGQRTVVLRDRAYKGKTYLEDPREVDPEFFNNARRMYDLRGQFNGKGK